MNKKIMLVWLVGLIISGVISSKIYGETAHIATAYNTAYFNSITSLVLNGTTLTGIKALDSTTYGYITASNIADRELTWAKFSDTAIGSLLGTMAVGTYNNATTLFSDGAGAGPGGHLIWPYYSQLMPADVIKDSNISSKLPTDVVRDSNIVSKLPTGAITATKLSTAAQALPSAWSVGAGQISGKVASATSADSATTATKAYGLQNPEIATSLGNKWTIDGPQITKGSITGTQIGPSQIIDGHITGIAAGKIAGQLTDSQINAVSATKITGAIGNTQIGVSAVTGDKIAASAVGSSKIAPASITAAHMAAGAIANTAFYPIVTKLGSGSDGQIVMLTADDSETTPGTTYSPGLYVYYLNQSWHPATSASAIRGVLPASALPSIAVTTSNIADKIPGDVVRQTALSDYATNASIPTMVSSNIPSDVVRAAAMGEYVKSVDIAPNIRAAAADLALQDASKFRDMIGGISTLTEVDQRNLLLARFGIKNINNADPFK